MYRLQAKGNKTAEMFIYEDIGDSPLYAGITAKQIAIDLKTIGAVEQIDVRINSYGGDVFEGLAIYTQLLRSNAKIITHIDGIAASIASIIAMAGKEIYISEASFVMVHDAWGAALGSASELRSYADRLEAMTDQLADIYVARTKATKSDIRSMMTEETWMDAGDAIKKGFADKMVENLRIAARLDPAKHKFKNTPAVVVQARPDYESASRKIASLTDRMPAPNRARLLQARGVG